MATSDWIRYMLQGNIIGIIIADIASTRRRRRRPARGATTSVSLRMGGGRERAPFAYRDLDEESVFPLLDHAYHSQTSPAKTPLSESVILRSHFDKTRIKRRRIALVAGGLMLLLGGSALVLLAKSLDAQQRSPLELTIAAPYGALRGKGDLKQSRRTPFAENLGTLRDIVPDGPSVGDFDPSDLVKHRDSEDSEFRPEFP